MNQDSTPVTHTQLKDSLTDFGKELRAEFKQMHGELRAEFKQMHDDLLRELARHVTASAEQTQQLIIGLDDRYRDLPGRVTVLERELDEHRRDTALHPRRRRR
jgi:hypothetical protein